MSNKVLQPLLATTLDHLLKTAGRSPEGVGLSYKHRGLWTVWLSRNVVAAADRHASGLRRHGVESGSAVAFAGEISPNPVIAALATRISGASLLSIAPDAKASAIHEAPADSADRPVQLQCGVGGRIVARPPRSRESSASLLASFTTLRGYRLGLSRLGTIEVAGVRKLLSHNDTAECLFTALGVPLRRIAPQPAGVEAKGFSSRAPLARLALTGVA